MKITKELISFPFVKRLMFMTKMCTVSYWCWGQDICDWIWLAETFRFDRDSPNVFGISLVSSSRIIDWFWETDIKCWPNLNMEIMLSSNALSADSKVAFAEFKSPANEYWYAWVMFDYTFSNPNCPWFHSRLFLLVSLDHFLFDLWTE